MGKERNNKWGRISELELVVLLVIDLPETILCLDDLCFFMQLRTSEKWTSTPKNINCY